MKKSLQSGYLERVGRVTVNTPLFRLALSIYKHIVVILLLLLFLFFFFGGGGGRGRGGMLSFGRINIAGN